MARQKIMVIKHGALGDMVQALDGFASLRAGHPDAQLTLLTTPPFASLARAMPFFDDVKTDCRPPFWSIAEMLRLRRLFRSGFTRIYDFQSSRRTCKYFTYLIPKSVEFVGIPRTASHPLPDMDGVNNRDRMVKTASLGGCPQVMADTDWLNDAEDTWQNEKPKKYAVLIPGCSPVKPAKRWPVEHFIDLASALMAKGLTPILVGTEIDRAAGEAICRANPEVVNKIGQTNLLELASLLWSAEFIVGGDTGPVFLGARLGTPTVMLMSVHTDPAMSAPVGAKARWLKDHDIAAITPEAVLAEWQRLMT
jgi:ADP-heptose:LPS heptosyltransferase